MALEILYQDQEYVAVFKPAGLLVHRSKIACEGEAVLQILRNQLTEKLFPVHRIDRPTSGVLVMARSPIAAKNLAAQFASRTVEKKYLALVRGFFTHEQLLDHPLTLEIEKKNDFKLQEAQTLFKGLARAEVAASIDRYKTSRFSLVEAIPKTGRTHQIRRHLKHLSHPIIGDVNHGNGKYNRYFSEILQIKGLLLTCVEIAFLNPVSNKEIKIRARLPENFQSAIAKLGMNYDSAT